MDLSRLTEAQIKTLVERHRARDVSFYSPSWKRHARIRWRLYNAENGFYAGLKGGNDESERSEKTISG